MYEVLLSELEKAEELKAARAYLVKTATPGGTMTRDGVANNIAKLHPVFVLRSAKAIAEAGIDCAVVNKVVEGRPHIVDMLKNDEITMVINTVEERRNAIADSRAIRISALAARVTTFTTIAGAEAVVEGMRYIDTLGVISVQEMHAALAD